MNFWVKLIVLSAIAFATGFTLAKAEEHDTDMLGKNTPVYEVPFIIRCMGAADFQTFLKKSDSKGLVNGDDYTDQELIMVFKTNANSLIFAKASTDGGTVCIFGATNDYSLDIGVALTQRSPPDPNGKGDFEGTSPEDEF